MPALVRGRVLERTRCCGAAPREARVCGSRKDWETAQMGNAQAHPRGADVCSWTDGGCRPHYWTDVLPETKLSVCEAADVSSHTRGSGPRGQVTPPQDPGNGSSSRSCWNGMGTGASGCGPVASEALSAPLGRRPARLSSPCSLNKETT